MARPPSRRASANPRAADTIDAPTASPRPHTGPKTSPAASVNAVRGIGVVVTIACARKKTSGAVGPSRAAQSRSSSGEGSGTTRATTTAATSSPSSSSQRVRFGTQRPPLAPVRGRSSPG